MELAVHPEYSTYLQHLDLDQACREALADWKRSGAALRVDEYALSWTYTQAQDFVGELSRFFDSYNRVLFEQYPACLACRGQCCLRGGAFVAAIDCLALGLLGLPYPRLPERIEASDSDCIYRGGQGCLWPGTWRTFKCWLFYCPGNALHHKFDLFAISAALHAYVEDRLPQPFRRYQSVSGLSLVSQVDNPLALAEGFGEALDHLFVQPLERLHPFLVGGQGSTYYRGSEAPQERFFCNDSEWAAFIQQVSAYLDGLAESSTVRSLMQCLADLETLEWIRLGKPGNALGLLEEMLRRYSRPAAGQDADRAWVCEHMRQQILRMMSQVHDSTPLF